MKYEDFSEEEIKKLVTELCDAYFNRNFGTLTKSELDLIMFRHYLNQKTVNNPISTLSDYEISKELGISQSRVRTLKTKNYLQNGTGLDWKNELIAIFNSGSFVKKNEDIEVVISDVNIMMELRHLLEEEKLIDEYVLNPKVFKCSIDVFVRVYEKLKGVKIGTSYENLCAYLKKNNPNISIKSKSFRDLFLENKNELQTIFPKTTAVSSLILKSCDYLLNKVVK